MGRDGKRYESAREMVETRSYALPEAIELLKKLPHAKLPPNVARQGVPLGVYYDWLKKIRLGLEGK